VRGEPSVNRDARGVEVERDVKDIANGRDLVAVVDILVNVR
jgi:hypothetical protein